MKKLTEKEYVAPWEKAFSKVLTPLEEFIHRQTRAENTWKILNNKCSGSLYHAFTSVVELALDIVFIPLNNMSKLVDRNITFPYGTLLQSAESWQSIFSDQCNLCIDKKQTKLINLIIHLKIYYQ